MIPLLFMGDEWAASEPFLFFTDHHDELADAVREGRRAEFADFAAFADEEQRKRIPDPNALQTFEHSRPALDALYLETDKGVDAKRVAILGVSRLGKAVLWAGAQDKRFAVVVPWLSGEGGASISRRFYGETVADLTNPARYDYWFAPRYQDYAFDVEKLPNLPASISISRRMINTVAGKLARGEPV